MCHISLPMFFFYVGEGMADAVNTMINGTVDFKILVRVVQSFF